MSDIAASLTKSSIPPAAEEAYCIWLEQKDALALLEANLGQDDFVVYASLGHSFMHAVLVPNSLLNPPNVQDLLAWNFTAHTSWGIWHDFADPPSIGMSPPLDHTGSKGIDHGEQLVFARSFDGRIDDRYYIEILQKFVHVFDLHFLPERNAYCRLDKHGDIEDVIRKHIGSDFDDFLREEQLEISEATAAKRVIVFQIAQEMKGSSEGGREKNPRA
jgi:hypothetical protein